jgi:hypothetical protein
MDLFRKRVAPLLTVVQVLFGLGLHAQLSADAQYVPNYISPSPNAAALMKFSDVPVSPYTGTADITVPIYTIHAKGIDVPVSLDYHSGGVKLKEEASWVGLGWALNAGGMISRTIMNYDDFGTQGYPYFTTVVPQLAGDMNVSQPAQQSNAPNYGPYYFDFYCNYNVNTTQGTENFWWAFTQGSTQYDMEPDIFSYNFPGHSGKFILTRAGQVVLQKQDNIVIQFQGTGSAVTFTITDEQGNKYYFNTLELSQTVGAAEPISSWLISKIVTQQQDSLKFSYVGGGANTSVAPDINQTENYACAATQGFFSTSPPPTLYYGQSLQSITFTDGELQFLFDQKRSDLQGGYKLDSVVLYSMNSAGTPTYQHEHDFYYSYFNGNYSAGADTFEYYRLKLDSVKEKSASGTLPPYSFVYNNPNPQGGSAKHSFNVDHWGYFNDAGNSVLIPSMGILYNPPTYNIYGQSEYINYSGANREPNWPLMETFSLQQINYPTGGSTVLQYQPNDYDFNNSSSGANYSFPSIETLPMDSIINIIDHGTTAGTINFSNVYPLLPVGSSQTNVTVNIAFTFQNNYGGSGEPPFPTIGSGKIQFTLTGPGVNITADIANATCQAGGPVCTLSYPITITGANNTDFNWSGSIASSVDTTVLYSETHVNIQYNVTQQTFNLLENNSLISPAAGLRIQNITNYKDPVTVASEKVYTYGYSADKLGTGTPQQYSYGRIMAFPSYVNYAITTTNGGIQPYGYCTQMSLFSGSNTSLTSAVTGNIVGYDQVTETSIDPLTGLDNGMTVYSYYNSNDSSYNNDGFGFPGSLNMGYNLDGLLKSKVEYANYGGIYTKISETDNYYHTTNRTVYFSPKYVYDGTGGNTGCTPDTGCAFQTTAIFYPSIKSERILLDSTVNFVYAQQNPSQFVLTHSYNYYDNPLHYQLTRSSTIDSKGDTLVTKIKYPQDYIPTGQQVTGNQVLDSMIGRNMVSETIEKQDSFYYPGSSAGYITGAQLTLFKILTTNNNTIVPSQTYKLDVQSPITNFQPFAISGNTTTIESRYREMISFDQYDNTNNVQQYTPTDQNSVTILWDYTHIYPIAQVKNAVVADVAATSFEADGTGNWTYTGTSTADTTSITGSYCYNLGQTNGNITKSGLTSSTTYILSYWTKNTSSLSIAGTLAGYPIKGKTIGPWTYYEYKLTGQTSLTISGSGYIDELRLYPSTALMTTYTYSPLVGMTTSCDADNKVTYYFYDAYQRLKRIKDQDGNIIKTFQYHYANQNPFNQ